MRKIEFRGKNFTDGDWEYGCALADCSYSECHIGDIYEYIHVDEATVGEFTGLKDSHGNRIYEGDIIRFGRGFFEICFSDGCFWVSNKNYTMELHSVLGMGDIEVIGNIHDNPEQLMLVGDRSDVRKGSDDE